MRDRSARHAAVMSWHEPGRDRDPWDGGQGGSSDLDEMLRRLRERLGRWFGRRPGPPRRSFVRIWWLAPLVIVGIWLLTGFYQVASGSKGVRLEFGAFAGISGPGVHWHWPWPIDRVYVLDVAEPRSVGQRDTVLTRDGKLATVEVTVRYRIADPYDYLFKVSDPPNIVNALAAAALADAARGYALAELQGGRQGAVEDALEKKIGGALGDMQAGLDVNSVKISRIALPQVVADAQQRLVADREHAAAQVTAARAAARASLAESRSRAHATVAAAQADAAARIADADSEVAAFRKLLPAWQADPVTTRETLREDAIGAILKAAPKVVVVGPVNSVAIPGWPGSAAPPASVPAPATRSGGK